MKSGKKQTVKKLLKAKSNPEIFRLMRQSHKLHTPRKLRRALTYTGKAKMPDWTIEEESLLGTMPDREAAKRLGRTVVAATLHRRRLGIPNWRGVKPWAAEELAILGTMPDRLAAQKLGRSRVAVMQKRTQLGIPNLIEGYHRWRPADDIMLGKRPDAEVAPGRYETRSHAVEARRYAFLKIYRRRPTPRFFQEWTPDEDALLGAMSDAAVARRIKCSPMAVANRRNKLKIPPHRLFWTPEDDALLKCLNDKEAARRLDRSIGAIKHRRQKLGLPPIEPAFVWWTPDEDKLLGTAPDGEIARRVGRTPDSVKNRRLSLGIRFSKCGRPSAKPVYGRKRITNNRSPTDFPPQGKPWTVKEWEQLGKAPDSVLARRFRRTIQSVVAMRTARRIALLTGARRWTARETRTIGNHVRLRTGAKVAPFPHPRQKDAGGLRYSAI